MLRAQGDFAPIIAVARPAGQRYEAGQPTAVSIPCQILTMELDHHRGATHSRVQWSVNDVPVRAIHPGSAITRRVFQSNFRFSRSGFSCSNSRSCSDDHLLSRPCASAARTDSGMASFDRRFVSLLFASNLSQRDRPRRCRGCRGRQLARQLALMVSLTQLKTDETRV